MFIVAADTPAEAHWLCVTNSMVITDAGSANKKECLLRAEESPHNATVTVELTIL